MLTYFLLVERYVVDRQRFHMAATFGVFVHGDHGKLLHYTFYLNIMKYPIKSKEEGKDQASIQSCATP